MPHEPGARRIAALVLPDLLCELASAQLRVTTRLHQLEQSSPRRRTRPVRAAQLATKEQKPVPPLGVVLNESAAGTELQATAELSAVNGTARSFGIREGQTVAEACAIVSNLVVREITRDEVNAALGRVAEVALAFGPTVAIEAPDTVWVDVTGSAGLFGSERQLGHELAGAVRSLGSTVRVAVANGPYIARAFARWLSPLSGEDATVRVVPHSNVSAELADLPVRALPIDAELVAWLARLGVLTIGDLAKLPRSAAGPRLGNDASLLLELCAGRDSTPLVQYRPPSCLVERTHWEDPVHGYEPLLFVVRGLSARMSARLAGRGEAAQKLELVIEHDRREARRNGVEPETRLHFDLASPLWREHELRRVVAVRLERARLRAPCVGLRLEVPAAIRALHRQLDFSKVTSGVTTGVAGLEQLPVLVAELDADLGKGRVGVLEVLDSHRPERKSQLKPISQEQLGAAKLAKTKTKSPVPAMSGIRALPNRLFETALGFDAPLCVGATVVIGNRLCSIEKLGFESRLDAVEWWAGTAVARDYVRVWLRDADGGFEAVVYIDRNTGKRYLQSITD